MSRPIDVAIVGGGIVGLAVAHALVTDDSRPSLVLLEKEDRVAAHQSGRNSGVIHSGIYYRPGSLKARTIASGRLALLRYCRDRGVPHELCGKVIVASGEDERSRLRLLADRARANGVEASLTDRSRLHDLEPRVAGDEALHVPGAGIVDYPGVCRALARDVVERGGEILLGQPVAEIEERRDTVILHGDCAIEARCVVNCAGLRSDRLSPVRDIRIIPFRGEYYELTERARGLVNNLVYPVPDPALPFLGVHLTRTLAGGIHVGPNAVLALDREGYTRRDIDLAETWSMIRFPGFRRLARHYWRTGADELWRSLSRTRFVRAVQHLVPDVVADDLVPSPSGVRAQALRDDGTLLDDFALHETARAVHVINAPSPAATASLEIGRVIARRVAGRLEN